MKTVFRLSDVSKSYGRRQIINKISMDVEAGKITAILGPNGAGKTTLMKAMALLTTIDEGSLEIMGEQMHGASGRWLEMRRRMAMVTQPVHMFSGSVFHNVSYGLRVRRRNSTEVKKKVSEALELVNMQDFRDYQARRLSAGEKQKVALARALVLRPEIVFLDEPTANIDPSSAIDIEKYIKIIRDELQSTVIMVTHNIFQARRVADRVIMLWDGSMIENQPTDELFNNPEDERTRAFICGDLYF